MKAIVPAEAGAVAERTEQPRHVVPVVNIFETPGGYAVDAEMPGVNKAGLELTLEGDALTLVGRRGRNRSMAGCCFATVVSRQTTGASLNPTPIDTNKISARLEQGLLTLILPKSEQVKPHKITVRE